MHKPVLAIGLLAVMAGAWYWALTSPVPGTVAHRDDAPRLGRRAGSEVPVVRLYQLAAESGRRPVPRGARNPFQARPVEPDRVSLPSAHRATATADMVPVAPEPPSWPRLELIGLAEARESAGLVRTAIVSGPQGVLHARPGDLLADVYRVERIAADGIDVRLLPEDRLVRLALRR